MDVIELRFLLPITRSSTYLNTGWAGPSPSPVTRRVNAVLEEEARLGGASQAGLDYVHAIQDSARDAVAALLGASSQEICLTHSTTEGVNIVLYGLPWQPGDGLLICGLEHPALTTPAQVLAERRGVQVGTAAFGTTASPKDILAAIEGALTPRTKLVALSHIQFTCGLRMPIKEIAALAHSRGIPLLVDGAQSGGHIALDVKDLGIDYYSISGQKWLMGPVGTGALYIRADRVPTLDPIFVTNAIANARPYLSSPVARFPITSQSPGLVAGFTEGIRLALSIGLPAIEERSRQLGSLLVKSASGIPSCSVLSPTAPGQSCGLTTLALEGWTPTDLAATLQDKYRIVARTVNNPPGVRFSTHYFNTEDEVRQVAVALTELANR